MKRYHQSGGLRRLMTLPSALSLLRIACVPLILYLYCARGAHISAALLLALSVSMGVLADWMIHRCGVTTDSGARLAPAARTLTLAGTLICLIAPAL